MDEVTVYILITVGIVFFIIYGIPLLITNKVQKGKQHEHSWTYCEIIKSCPHYKESGLTKHCELKKCIYSKDEE